MNNMNNMNNKINIIIIGAKNYNEDYDKDNIETFNNQKQAEYNTLIILKNNLEIKNYIVSITCFDGGYVNNISDGPIKYINEYFALGDTKYLDKNAHNIFIEYCNLLDEYFVTKSGPFDNQVQNILKYNDFKITFLSCGCSWNLDFPYDLVNIIIKKKYYTPTDVYNADSFLISIGINNNIDEKNQKIMIPYMQGIYQILGSLMWRGWNDDYSSENVLYDLFNIIDDGYFKLTIEEKNELKKFTNKEIHWNALNRNIRCYFTKYIYGSNIIIT